MNLRVVLASKRKKFKGNCTFFIPFLKRYKKKLFTFNYFEKWVLCHNFYKNATILQTIVLTMSEVSQAYLVLAIGLLPLLVTNLKFFNIRFEKFLIGFSFILLNEVTM